MEYAVSVKNITHNYNNERVLDDISFSVTEKEFFIITGPNGSGKTTLVKTVAGIIKQDGGSIEILGRKIDNYAQKELARIIAFVPQETLIEFPFTVEELVFMGRAPHLGILGIGEEKDILSAKQAMEFTGIEKLSQRRLNELSGGERQRAFISRALCQEPKILILDEPTASLDLSHKINIMKLLKKLKSEQNMTIIMVTHDLNFVAMYGEKVLLMDKGKVVKIGTPENVFNRNILEKVYNCRLIIDKSPAGNFPRITPAI
jgi:iron complex transport system ATP-binding protein